MLKALLGEPDFWDLVEVVLEVVLELIW